MLLEVKDLTVYYGTVRALEKVSFRVDRGEIVAMIGPNGAGKSTALKAVFGLIDKVEGQIELQGEGIKDVPPDLLVRKGMSLVPEGRRLFTTMTVLENLEMGAYTLNRSQKSEVRSQIREVFELFPGLKKRQRQRAGTLSSGEQQMLAMGRALMLKPKLLLLDEPSLGLSPNYADLVFDRIKEINKDGVGILLVEQNAQMALEIADRGYVFKVGEIAFEDTGKNLLENALVRKAFLCE